MRQFLVALLGVPVGYLVFAFAGLLDDRAFSNNAFDRSLEVSMTGVFVIGSGGAIIGFIAGLVLGGARRRVTRT
jgi:NhaP-type Na+/H+ or K+/H+ antiporter